LLEARVVADGRQVVVRPRLLAERLEQLDRPLEVAERLVVDLARERREARVVEVEARLVGELLEAAPDRVEGIGVALLVVGGDRLALKRPGFTPVDRLVRLAGLRADGEDGSLAGRFPPHARRN